MLLVCIIQGLYVKLTKSLKYRWAILSRSEFLVKLVKIGLNFSPNAIVASVHLVCNALRFTLVISWKIVKYKPIKYGFSPRWLYDLFAAMMVWILSKKCPICFDRGLLLFISILILGVLGLNQIVASLIKSVQCLIIWLHGFLLKQNQRNLSHMD